MRVLKGRLVLQKNAETEEVNMVFTTDPLTPNDDFKVNSPGGWREAPCDSHEVVLVAPEEVLRELSDKEFRTTCSSML
jgi:hypothetical protein